MLRIVFEIILCIFATYGFISLTHELVPSIRQKSHYKNSMVKLVLVVKNQGEVIEGVLRNLVSRDFIRKLMPGGRLIILDMGSKDDTLDILRKLEKDYECLEVLKRSEKDNIFTHFEESDDNEKRIEHIRNR